MDGCGFVEKKSQYIHVDENFMLRISSKLECFGYHHFNNKLNQQKDFWKKWLYKW